MKKIHLIAPLSSLLLFGCIKPTDGSEGYIPAASKTINGVIYNRYDSELTESQRQWERKITQAAFEIPFWNASRTRAVVYMRSRDKGQEVNHQFYFYRLNSVGWMELFGAGEFISNYYTAARKATVKDDNFLISLWNADGGGKYSVTITYPMDQSFVSRKKMRNKEEVASTKSFDASKIKHPHLNIKF